MNNKTHYRKVFKSDHLGVADLEDLIESRSSLIFTIREVRQELGARVAGNKGDFNIAYFKESIKPWVLNAGSCAIMKKFCGGSPHVEDWANTTVQLYIDPNAKYKGQITGGVRINPNPVPARKKLEPANKEMWANAIAAYKRDGNLDAVLVRVDISAANAELIKSEAKTPLERKEPEGDDNVA